MASFHYKMLKFNIIAIHIICSQLILGYNEEDPSMTVRYWTQKRAQPSKISLDPWGLLLFVLVQLQKAFRRWNCPRSLHYSLNLRLECQFLLYTVFYLDSGLEYCQRPVSCKPFMSCSLCTLWWHALVSVLHCNSWTRVVFLCWCYGLKVFPRSFLI